MYYYMYYIYIYMCIYVYIYIYIYNPETVLLEGWDSEHGFRNEWVPWKTMIESVAGIYNNNNNNNINK